MSDTSRRQPVFVATDAVSDIMRGSEDTVSDGGATVRYNDLRCVGHNSDAVLFGEVCHVCLTNVLWSSTP